MEGVKEKEGKLREPVSSIQRGFFSPPPHQNRDAKPQANLIISCASHTHAGDKRRKTFAGLENGRPRALRKDTDVIT